MQLAEAFSIGLQDIAVVGFIVNEFVDFCRDASEAVTAIFVSFW